MSGLIRDQASVRNEVAIDSGFLMNLSVQAAPG